MSSSLKLSANMLLLGDGDDFEPSRSGRGESETPLDEAGDTAPATVTVAVGTIEELTHAAIDGDAAIIVPTGSGVESAMVEADPELTATIPLLSATTDPLEPAAEEVDETRELAPLPFELVPDELD